MKVQSSWSHAAPRARSTRWGRLRSRAATWKMTRRAPAGPIWDLAAFSSWGKSFKHLQCTLYTVQCAYFARVMFCMSLKLFEVYKLDEICCRDKDDCTVGIKQAPLKKCNAPKTEIGKVPNLFFYISSHFIFYKFLNRIFKPLHFPSPNAICFEQVIYLRYYT